MPPEKFEDTKWINRRKRQYNDQKKKENNYVQYTTQKTKDRGIQSPLKTGDEPRCSGRVGSSCSICDNRITLVTTSLRLRQTEHIRGHL
jgi:hypothetical protein